MIDVNIYIMPRNDKESTYHERRKMAAVPREGELLELSDKEDNLKTFKVTEVTNTPDEHAHSIALTVQEI